MSLYSVDKLMNETRRLAAEYRKATGKSLPVSSELAVYDAARLLDLDLVDGDQGGYDAVGRQSPRQGKRIQIKARAIFNEEKSGQRIGQLKIDKEWDSVMLVLMDHNYEPFEIYELDRDEALEILNETAQSKRSNRGAMSVARFKAISHLVWNSEQGRLDETVWDNHAEGV